MIEHNGHIYYQFKIGDFGLSKLWSSDLTPVTPLPAAPNSLHQLPWPSQSNVFRPDDDQWGIGYIMLEAQQALRIVHQDPAYAILQSNLMNRICDIDQVVQLADQKHAQMVQEMAFMIEGGD
jgi:hypothetical protein